MRDNLVFGDGTDEDEFRDAAIVIDQAPRSAYGQLPRVGCDQLALPNRSDEMRWPDEAPGHVDGSCQTVEKCPGRDSNSQDPKVGGF